MDAPADSCLGPQEPENLGDEAHCDRPGATQRRAPYTHTLSPGVFSCGVWTSACFPLSSVVAVATGTLRRIPADIGIIWFAQVLAQSERPATFGPGAHQTHVPGA